SRRTSLLEKHREARNLFARLHGRDPGFPHIASFRPSAVAAHASRSHASRYPNPDHPYQWTAWKDLAASERDEPGRGLERAPPSGERPTSPSGPAESSCDSTAT